MWILVIATLFNAVASQESVINNVRLTFGPIYVGTMEACMTLLLGYALVFGGGIASIYPNRRTHPALLVILVLWILATITGSIESFLNGVEFPLYLRSAREFAAWPLYLFVGYRMLATPKSAYRFIYLIVLAGTCTATILLLHFGENAEQSGASDNLSFVRSVQYLNAYAGMAAMVLIYSMISGIKLLPTVIALPLACYCLVGQCAPLHRGEWLAMMFCLALMLFLIDREKIAGTIMKGVIVGVLISVGVLFAIGIAGRLMGRDFNEKVQKRFITMLPTARETSTETKAWDTRLDSVWAELDIWKKNPVFGQGFAIQDTLAFDGKIPNYGAFNHNGWASVLAKTGLLGFIPGIMFAGSLVWVGRKLVLNHAHPGTTLLGALAVMCGGYVVAGILAGIVWSMRFAMLFGVVGGMAYRCLNMQESMASMDQSSHSEPPPDDGQTDQAPVVSDGFDFSDHYTDQFA